MEFRASGPGSANGTVPTAQRPVSVQLDECNIPKDQSLDQPGSLLLPRCSITQKGFPRKGGENNLKKLSVISVMKPLNQRAEKPSRVFLSTCLPQDGLEGEAWEAALGNGRGGPPGWGFAVQALKVEQIRQQVGVPPLPCHLEIRCVGSCLTGFFPPPMRPAPSFPLASIPQ